MLTAIFVGLAILYAGIYLYRAALIKQAEDALATVHGCLPPPTLDTGRLPWGLQLIVKAFRTAKEQRLLRLMNEIVHETGPTFEQKLLGFRGIDTVEPLNVEAVLSKQFTDFGLGERRLVFAPLLGDGIFTQDGKFWERSRALLRPAFQNRDHSLMQIAGAADSLIRLIPIAVAVDLQPLFFRYTLETTSYLLFGRRIGVLESSTGYTISSFALAFDEAQDYLAQRGRLGGLYWLIDGPTFRRRCRHVHEHVDKAINNALRSQSASDKQPAYTILGALMEQTRDLKVLREQCLNVLLAGRDTTACLLSWTFRLLARHPAVFRRCREEIISTCPSTVQLTRAGLKQMKYLDAVLKEVLRLYPSVPINSRMANRTTTLPTGGGPNGSAPILVRKGESVGYCPYVMHRREEIFGADAAAFRPERWLDQGGQLGSRVGYGYLPFNAGPRICLGQEFALLEAGYLIVRILQRFPNLNLPSDEHVVTTGEERQKLTLVLSSADGCRAVLS